MADLKTSLAPFGVDFEATMERFVDDIDLYKECFLLFIDDENWTTLDEAIAEKKYQEAFDAAHTLKGIAGNLGIMSAYAAICAVVESLRTADYTYLNQQLSDMKAIFEQLKQMKMEVKCCC